MIKCKPTEPIWMVLSEDPALIPADPKDVQNYLIDRDISHFDIDIDRGIYNPTKEKVTLFKIIPLRNEFYYLVELGVDGFAKIVKNHVVKVVNFEADIKVSTSKGGLTEISDEDIEKFDLEVLSEVAAVIIEKGKGKDGDDRAFFSAATSRLQRQRSLQLPANLARIDLAKITESDTSSGE